MNEKNKKNLKISAAVAVKAGLDTLRLLLRKVNIDFVIGLEPPKNPDSVSGYINISEFCEKNNLEYYLAKSYSLDDPRDKEIILSKGIDILLVLGWQRLIPPWLIEHVKLGVLGAHGSSYGIARGRGRSPQNWALILGEKEFELSVFKIDPGIDSGKVLMSRKFTYTDFDDIETSYYKVSWLVSEMLLELLSDPQKIMNSGVEQSDEPRYLPTRKPEDGAIDWHLTKREIYNFIRALTSPYPGAFTYWNDVKITIYKAIPFDVPIDFGRFSIGEICVVYASTKNFVVKCSDGFILVRQWLSDKDWTPEEGMILKNADFRKQIREIVERWYKQNPNLILNENILKILQQHR